MYHTLCLCQNRKFGFEELKPVVQQLHQINNKTIRGRSAIYCMYVTYIYPSYMH